MDRSALCCVLPLWLGACVVEEEAALLADDALPPPITLFVGPLERGLPVTFGVQGANPGDNVVFVRSSAGPGAGPCPPPLQGGCVGVLAPTVMFSLTANGAGNAQRTVTLPSTLPLGTSLSFQAFAVGSGGVFESPIAQGTVVGEASFAQDVQPIFDAHCVSCHSPPGASAGLNLSVDGFNDIVNQGSNQSALDFVEPGARTQSYLWHKIAGTQGSVGGSGGRMPLGRPQLSARDRGVIGQWIDEGAVP
jgi:hypothetical protein